MANRKLLLPYPQISEIEESAPAIPSLWNNRYGQIDQNFDAIALGLGNQEGITLKKDSDTGAAFLPVGDISQQGEPLEGKYRFNAEKGKFEGADGEKWGDVGGGGFMFEIKHWLGSLESLPEDFLPLDGQQVSELQRPGFQQAIIDSGQPTISAEEWEGGKTLYGTLFGIGEGFTYLPMWNHKPYSVNIDESMGAMYFAGNSQRDIHGYATYAQNKRHSHETQITESGEHVHELFGTAGTNVAGSHTHGLQLHYGGRTNSGRPGGTETNGSYVFNTNAGGDHSHTMTSAAMGLPEPHTHDCYCHYEGEGWFNPKTVYGTWVIRVSGAITTESIRTLQLMAAKMIRFQNDVIALDGGNMRMQRQLEQLNAQLDDQTQSFENIDALYSEDETVLTALAAQPLTLAEDQEVITFTGFKKLGAIYTNDNDCPINCQVTLSTFENGGECKAYVNDELVDIDLCVKSGCIGVDFLVPAKADYWVESDAQIVFWNELK